MSVEILFLAWNRLDFTRVSFELLRRNTRWSDVDRLIVYDDGSTDGTAEHLQEAGETFPVPAFEFRQVNFNSPPATMNDYLASAPPGGVFAKIDNDIAVPPRWLDAMLDVFDRNPELELLGAEAAMTGLPVKNVRQYHWTPASHIGGVGVMRVDSFHSRPPLKGRGRFGFTEWQHTHDPVRGWITPDLRMLQLDRLPLARFVRLSSYYVEQGWQREWPKYDSLRPWWWEWLKKERLAA